MPVPRPKVSRVINKTQTTLFQNMVTVNRHNNNIFINVPLVILLIQMLDEGYLNHE